MNGNAFNLFTALVAFLLIMVTVLLVQSMIQTERKNSEIISAMSSKSELQAVADMTRADALQVFNYTLRKRTASWLSDPNNVFSLSIGAKSWEEVKRAYATDMFGGPDSVKFADFIAGSLVALLYSEAQFGNYSVSLEGASKDLLREKIQTVVSKSIEADDFFKVIGCPNGIPNTCEKGTFYINLKLGNISDQDYESLPRIRVVNKATGDEIKTVILPRSDFHVYVPIRIFKAIAEARALAHFPVTADDSEINTSGDYGLFSPRIHNQIEEMALGMCDYGYCAPRENPLLPPTKKSWSGTSGGTSSCPGDPVRSTDATVSLSCPFEWCSAPESYKANEEASAERALKQIVESRVCSIVEAAKQLKELDPEPNDGFSLIGSYCNGLVQQIAAGVSSRISKHIESPGTETQDFEEIAGYSGAYSESSCPMSQTFGLEETRRVGLFGTAQGNVSYPENIDKSIECSGSREGSAKCTEVTQLSVILAFREDNSIYKVNKNEEVAYKIRLVDTTYVPFTARYDDSGPSSSTCALSSEPAERECSFAKGSGWACLTVWEIGEMPSITGGGEAPQPVGCMPW